MSVDVKANGVSKTLVETSDLSSASVEHATGIKLNGARVYPLMSATQFGFNIYPETGTTFTFAGHTGTRMQITFSTDQIAMSIYENGSWVTLKTFR